MLGSHAALGAAMWNDSGDTPVHGGAVVARADSATVDLPRLNGCVSAADLHGWLRRLARCLGFFGARYTQFGRPVWGLDDAAMGRPIRHLSTSGDAEREDEAWIRGDPALARIRGGYAPFGWSTRASGMHSAEQRAWLDEERGRGVDAGLAIPVQDSGGCPAYVSLFGRDMDSVQGLIDRRAPELAFIAAQFHALAKTLLPVAPWVDPGPRLSSRELECLKLAALGQTVDESGQTLGISGRTVEFHLRNALEKLGAPTKLRAVVLAFGAGVAVL